MPALVYTSGVVQILTYGSWIILMITGLHGCAMIVGGEHTLRPQHSRCVRGVTLENTLEHCLQPLLARVCRANPEDMLARRAGRRVPIVP